MIGNYKEISKFFDALTSTGEVRELRIFEKNYIKYIGYFDDLEKIKKTAYNLSKDYIVYTTLNPVKKECLGRVPNQITRQVKGLGTKDKDIQAIKYCLVDVDPCRDPGTSSTHDEKNKAYEIIQKISEKYSPLLLLDSGNGYHAILRSDAKEAQQTRNFLTELGKEFSTEQCKVDLSVFNPCRITKVAGTWARKGENTSIRPHRMACIICLDHEAPTINMPKYVAPTFSSSISEFSSFPQSPNREIDLESLLGERIVSRETISGGRTKLVLNHCLFNPEHKKKDAAVFLGDPPGYKCFHNSCSGKTIKDVFRLFGIYKKEKRCKYCHAEIVFSENGFGNYVPTNPGTKLPHKCISPQKTTSRNIAETSKNKTEESVPKEVINKDIPKETSKKIPEFPLEIFSSELRDYIEEVSKCISCPIDFPAFATIAALSVLCGQSTIEIKSGYPERPNLYCAIVAESGSAKSPSINLILDQSIFAVSDILKEENENRQKDYERDQFVYESEMVEFKTRLKQGIVGYENIPVKPEKPGWKETFTTNVTTEALVEIMENNPDGILLLKDELTGWIKSLDQYRAGKGEDREFFLSVHSGSRAKIFRKNKKPVEISHPRLSILGGIVPENLNVLSGKVTDGFFERILFIFPERMERRWSPDPIKEYTANLAKKKFLEVREFSPQEIKLSEEAKLIWACFWEDRSKNSSSYIPKLLSMTARLMLIISCMKNKKICGAQEINDAIKLSTYFQAHIEKVRKFAGQSEEMHQNNAIIKWAKKKGHTKLRTRILCRAGLKGCESAKKAKEKMNELVELGLAEWSMEGREVLLV